MIFSNASLELEKKFILDVLRYTFIKILLFQQFKSIYMLSHPTQLAVVMTRQNKVQPEIRNRTSVQVECFNLRTAINVSFWGVKTTSTNELTFSVFSIASRAKSACIRSRRSGRPSGFSSARSHR